MGGKGRVGGFILLLQWSIDSQSVSHPEDDYDDQIEVSRMG